MKSREREVLPFWERGERERRRAGFIFLEEITEKRKGPKVKEAESFREALGRSFGG